MKVGDTVRWVDVPDGALVPAPGWSDDTAQVEIVALGLTGAETVAELRALAGVSP